MAEFYSQRRLALELRYAIDMARQAQHRGWAWNGHRQRLIQVIADHPEGMASRHVLHNLGSDRIDWLAREDIFVEIANHHFVADPKNDASRICASCKLPLGHPVHGKARVVHGTATPKKTG